MRKLIIVMLVEAGFSVSAFGQGTVLFATSASPHTKVSVNSLGEPSTFTLAPAADTFYYALFASTSSSLVLGSSSAVIPDNGNEFGYLANFVFDDPNWTFVTYGQSYGVAGKFAATATLNSDETVTIPFATAGSPINLVALGWSSNIGTTYQSVESFFGDFSTVGYVGESAVATITAGSLPGNSGAPFSGMFGSGPGQVSGLELGEGPLLIPEPSTLALGALGGLSVLALRRKHV